MKTNALKSKILKCIHENKSNPKLEIYNKAQQAIQNSHNSGSMAMKAN